MASSTRPLGFSSLALRAGLGLRLIAGPREQFSALQAAAKAGDSKGFKQALDRGAPLQLASQPYGSALHEACQALSDSACMIDIALERGADPFAPLFPSPVAASYAIETALKAGNWAAANRWIGKIVQDCLLEPAPAPLDSTPGAPRLSRQERESRSQESQGRTLLTRALRAACQRCQADPEPYDTEAARHFFELALPSRMPAETKAAVLGFAPGARRQGSQSSLALSAACLPALRALLKAGFPPDDAQMGCEALFIAIQKGKPLCAAALLEAGSNPNATPPGKGPALARTWALSRSPGAPNTYTPHRVTPSVAREIIPALIAAGADFESPDFEGLSFESRLRSEGSAHDEPIRAAISVARAARARMASELAPSSINASELHSRRAILASRSRHGAQPSP